MITIILITLLLITIITYFKKKIQIKNFETKEKIKKELNLCNLDSKKFIAFYHPNR